ncbi:MAG: MBL fold metallo-hydrolase RNA specificity domain-containing protein [Dehalococcoidia bacterium]
MVSITVYGGVREIGGNKILVESNGRRVFLDFGLSFSGMGTFYEEFLQPRTNNGLRDLLALGILPKLDGIYRQDLIELDNLEDALAEAAVPDKSLWVADVKSYDDVRRRDGRPFVDAVILSHAHMDHFQHVSVLDENIPVFCSATTRAIMEAAEEIGRGGFGADVINVGKRSVSTLGGRAFFPGAHKVVAETVPRAISVVGLREQFDAGAMRAELYPVDHSVPGAAAIVLTTDSGHTVCYTGDLRFHGRAGHLTKAFRDGLARSEPDVLLAEGTRIEKEEPDSEDAVREECTRLVSQAKGALAMVGFAWKDTTRYQTMLDVARETGRTLVVSSKLAYLLHKLNTLPDPPARPVSEEANVQVYLKRKESMLYSKGDYVNTKYDMGYSAEWAKSDPSTIRTEHYESGARAYDIAANPGRYLLHLDFYELNELIDLRPPAGSIYISAVSEPFDMEMELDKQRLTNWLRRFGINPPEFEPRYVHASGHASGPELIEMIKEIRPKMLIPVHTEHPEAFEQALASSGIEVRIPSVGEAIVIG